MKIRRRTEIQIEAERTLIISRRRSLKLRCEACAGEVRMITVDEAAILTRNTARAIFRQVEAGAIHFAETPDGRLLICADSLK
ncbi:MAG: hypothetical protein WCB68_14040 [Pyrinomonadaceae bacterium]